jgi:succinate dehydrogenase/fumarate reductase flavoprotein subunit
MLAACNVFGARAGRRAAERSASARRELDENSYDNLRGRLSSFASGSSADWQAIRGELKSASAAAVLVIRDHAGLGTFLDKVAMLRERLKVTGLGDTPVSALRALETENLLLVAEVMGRAALLRQESRGSHYRADYQRLDDDRWNRSIFWTLHESGFSYGLGRFRQDPDLDNQLENGIAWNP